ncbi:Cyclic nucleotide-binding domain-containing protein [Plasmodiophora brassicae]|nr:hypothetical protein PBRA_008906 [Plasmodiophora brassicae]
MAIVGLEQSTFIWLPRSTGQEVTEAYRIAQLEAWRPVIDVLLWQRSTWTPELVLALVDHAEGPYVTPALGYVYRQGDPTASRMVIIAAGSAVEFETDDESKLHLAVYEAGQFAGLEVCSTGKHRRTWLQAAKADVQWYALDAGVIRSEHPAIWDILVDVDEGRRLGTVRRERQHRRCRRAMALLEGNQRVRDGAADRERQEQRTQRLMKMLPKLASQGDDRRRSTLAAINIDIFRSHRDSTRRVPNFLHKLSSTPRRADEFRHGIDAALNGSADNDNDMDESDGLASAASAPAAAQARRRAPSLPKRERRRTAAERLSIVVPSGVAQLSAQGSRLNVKIFGKDVA